MIPALVNELHSAATRSSRRAAAATLSGLLTSSKTATTIIREQLLFPFLAEHGSVNDLPLEIVLQALINLLLNSEPTPSVVTELLLPSFPSLYAILDTMERVKTANPIIKGSLSGILTTCGRLASSQEFVEVLWNVIQNKGGSWKIEQGGRIQREPEYGVPAHILTADGFLGNL